MNFASLYSLAEQVRAVSPWGDLARPERLPLPNCRVMFVAGPVGAGKTHYVRQHAGPNDIVIDLDAIAAEYGLGRDRSRDSLTALLLERNDRLAALAHEPPHRVAWVEMCAPSRKLRQWWCRMLGVAADDVIVLAPSRDELKRRIMRDPERNAVRGLHMRLVDQWFDRERSDHPGYISPGVGIDGFPTDPLHRWNG